MRSLLLIFLFFIAIQSEAATYYVRPGGGDHTVCDGTVNVDAPGNEGHCAWSHPFEALGVKDSTVNLPHISGGDTVIIANGSYRMGHTPGIYDEGKCHQNWPWSCVMGSPPAGPDADHPTRILGEGWNSGCANPPELYGVEKAKQVISMFNTANIELQCLEITDHSNCSTNTNLGATVNTCSTSYPYGDWAVAGIKMNGVRSWYMKNVNVHGMTGSGIKGAEVTDWSVEDSRISYNSRGGLNGEDVGITHFYGVLSFRKVDISWNGCTENYPIDDSIVEGSCVGGNNGGFGDGVGLAETEGEWHWDNCSFVGNVEDGLDMLYMRTGTGISYVSNSLFKHNAGNDLKVGANSVITNNILTGDCNYYENKSIDGGAVGCRGNATLAVVLEGHNSSSTIVNNSFSGQSDMMIYLTGTTGGQVLCDGTERAYIANNIFRGGSHFQTPSTKKVDSYYLSIESVCPGFKHIAKNNLFFNSKNETDKCADSVDSVCGQDPRYISFDEINSIYDFRFKENSPAINMGLPMGEPVGYNDAISNVPSLDYYGNERDIVDIGMFEYKGENDNGRLLQPVIKLIREN